MITKPRRSESRYRSGRPAPPSTETFRNTSGIPPGDTRVLAYESGWSHSGTLSDTVSVWYHETLPKGGAETVPPATSLGTVPVPYRHRSSCHAWNHFGSGSQSLGTVSTGLRNVVKAPFLKALRNHSIVLGSA